MTNAEYFKIKEELAEATIEMLRNCDCNMIMLDYKLFREIVAIYKKIEEY